MGGGAKKVTVKKYNKRYKTVVHSDPSSRASSPTSFVGPDGDSPMSESETYMSEGEITGTNYKDITSTTGTSENFDSDDGDGDSTTSFSSMPSQSTEYSDRFGYTKIASSPPMSESEMDIDGSWAQSTFSTQSELRLPNPESSYPTGLSYSTDTSPKLSPTDPDLNSSSPPTTSHPVDSSTSRFFFSRPSPSINSPHPVNISPPSRKHQHLTAESSYPIDEASLGEPSPPTSSPYITDQQRKRGPSQSTGPSNSTSGQLSSSPLTGSSHFINLEKHKLRQLTGPPSYATDEVPTNKLSPPPSPSHPVNPSTGRLLTRPSPSTDSPHPASVSSPSKRHFTTDSPYSIDESSLSKPSPPTSSSHTIERQHKRMSSHGPSDPTSGQPSPNRDYKYRSAQPTSSSDSTNGQSSTSIDHSHSVDGHPPKRSSLPTAPHPAGLIDPSHSISTDGLPFPSPTEQPLNEPSSTGPSHPTLATALSPPTSTKLPHLTSESDRPSLSGPPLTSLPASREPSHSSDVSYSSVPAPSRVSLLTSESGRPPPSGPFPSTGPPAFVPAPPPGLSHPSYTGPQPPQPQFAQPYMTSSQSLPIGFPENHLPTNPPMHPQHTSMAELDAYYKHQMMMMQQNFQQQMQQQMQQQQQQMQQMQQMLFQQFQHFQQGFQAQPPPQNQHLPSEPSINEATPGVDHPPEGVSNTPPLSISDSVSQTVTSANERTPTAHRAKSSRNSMDIPTSPELVEKIKALFTELKLEQQKEAHIRQETQGLSETYDELCKKNQELDGRLNQQRAMLKKEIDSGRKKQSLIDKTTRHVESILTPNIKRSIEQLEAEKRQLVTLIILQQRILVRLRRMEACERIRSAAESANYAESKSQYEDILDKRDKLFEEHSTLIAENAKIKREIEDMKKEDPIMKKRIEGLEQLVVLGLMERSRRELLVEEWKNMRECLNERATMLKSSGESAIEYWLKYLETIRSEVEKVRDKIRQLFQRIESIKKIEEIAAQFPDLSLDINWSSIVLRRVDEFKFEWRLSERDIRRVQLTDRELIQHQIESEYRISLKGPIDYGSFRAVYSIKDEEDASYVGKIFHLRRGLDEDTQCAKRVIKSKMLAEAAVNQFSEELERNREGCTLMLNWEFAYVDATYINIKDPMPNTSQAPEGKPKMTCMMIEQALDSDKWKKFTDPFGNLVVNGTIPETPTTPEDVCLVLDTFSHWSWYASGRRFMVVDHQGMTESYDDDGQEKTKVVLTDPGVHVVGPDLWDTLSHDCDGNYRRGGVIKYFENHKCNAYCELLKINDNGI